MLACRSARLTHTLAFTISPLSSNILPAFLAFENGAQPVVRANADICHDSCSATDRASCRRGSAVTFGGRINMLDQIYLVKWKSGGFAFLFSAKEGMFCELDKIGSPSEAEVRIVPPELMQEVTF